MSNTYNTYKGVRDFYPIDQRIQQYMFDAMRRTCNSYGYDEYHASVLEPTELYLAKTSSEIINEQTYTFIDRGERSVTLRPEMTPTVARMVAARKRELGVPLRLFSIPNLFRYEKSQRGRLREHWQLNVDLFGAPDTAADIEIISVADSLLKELGATAEMYSIRVSSRTLLNAACLAAGMSPAQIAEYRALLDRKNKITDAEYATALSAIYPTDPLTLIDSSDDRIANELSELNKIISTLTARGVPVSFDPTIVRGFDYYTGTVFEIFDSHSDNNRSMMGGGRYDNLVGEYGPEGMPACGFGLGDVTLRLFLENHGLLPTLTSSAQLYLIPLNESYTEAAETLAIEIRKTGVNVALGIKHSKVGDHIRNAEKLGITHVAVYGDDEVSSQVLTVKNIVDGTEARVSVQALQQFFTQGL